MTVDFPKRHNRFASMDSDALREILRQDALSPETEQLDVDTILLILDILAERDPAEPQTVDAAQASFRTNYLPISDTTSLFELDLPLETEPEKMLPRKKNPRLRRILGKSAAVAAAFLVLVLTGGMSAQALGFDLWGAVAEWTDSLFSFSISPTESDDGFDPHIQELYHGFEAYEFLYPTYIPEGFTLIEADSVMEPCYEILTAYKKDTECIIISYFRHPKIASFYTEYNKDAGTPELYTHDGIEFYIMTNVNEYFATWMYSGFECCISGVETKEELIRMIDSLELVNK